MPYKIIKANNLFMVINEAGRVRGRVKGRVKSRVEARRMIRAIHANKKDKK